MVSAAITSRIKIILPKIISESQIGIIKGRFIEDNILRNWSKN